LQIIETQELTIKATILKTYQKSLKIIDRYIKTKDKTNNIIISTEGLNDALNEIILDINILNKRRDYDYLARGKIAGIIIFRLSRWNILNGDNSILVNDRTFLKLNFILALLTGLAYIQVDYTKIENYIRNEIIYTLMRRHVNQETLGIVCDLLRTYIK